MSENSNLRKEASRTTKDIESLLKRIKNHRQDKQKVDQPQLVVIKQQPNSPNSQANPTANEEPSEDSVGREVSSIKHSLGIVHHSKDLKENLQMVKRQLSKLLTDREEDEERFEGLKQDLTKQLAVIMSLEQTRTDHQAKLMQLGLEVELKNQQLSTRTSEFEHILQETNDEKLTMAASLRQSLLSVQQLKCQNLQLWKEESQSKQISESLQQTNKAQIERLKGLLQVLKEEGEKKVAELSSNISDKERQLAEFKLKNEEDQYLYKDEMDRLKAEIRFCNQRLSRQADVGHKQTEELLELRQGVQVSLQKIERLEEKIFEKDLNIQELVLKLAGCQEQSLEQIEQLRKQVENQNSRHCAETKEKEDTIKDLRQKLQWSKAVDDDLQRRVEDLQGANDALNVQMEQHQQAIEEIGKLNQNVLRLNLDLRSVKQELEQARHQAADKDVEIAQLSCRSESEKRMLEAEIQQLRDTISQQSERISGEQLVVRQLRTILSRKVEKLSEALSEAPSEASQHGRQRLEEDSPTINVIEVPLLLEDRAKVDKKQSGKSFFSDTPQSISKSSQDKPASETTTRDSVQSQEDKIRDQLMTIQTLTKKIVVDESERELELKRFRNEMSLMREQFEQQKQSLLNENIQLRGLIAKLSVPSISQEDPDDECRNKLKLLASTLKNLHSLADDEELIKNEVIEKMLVLLNVVNQLKEQIRETELQQLSSTTELVNQQSSNSRSRKSSGWRKVTTKVDSNDDEDVRSGCKTDRKIELSVRDFSCQTGEDEQDDCLFRKAQSVMLMESLNVESPQKSDAQHQTDMNCVEKVHIEQQTNQVLTIDQSIEAATTNSVTHTPQQTAQIATSSTQIQADPQPKLAVHIEQQTHTPLTIDQQQQAKSLSQLKRHQTISIVVSEPTKVHEIDQQTEAPAQKQTESKDLQTEPPEMERQEVAQQTDTTPVACSLIQTTVTIESLNNESIAHSNQIRQMQTAMQNNSQHYMKLVQALNQEIAFLKDSSRTE